MPSLLALSAHEPRPERAIGFVLIVTLTPQANAVHGRLPSARHGLDVVVLQKFSGLAAVTGLADERASALIALVHGAFHVRRDVTPVGARIRARPRPVGRRELPLLELGDERFERAVEYLRDISRGQLVAQQRLDMPELVVRLLADCELDRETLGRERSHSRTVEQVTELGSNQGEGRSIQLAPEPVQMRPIQLAPEPVPMHSMRLAPEPVPMRLTQLAPEPVEGRRTLPRPAGRRAR